MVDRPDTQAVALRSCRPRRGILQGLADKRTPLSVRLGLCSSRWQYVRFFLDKLALVVEKSMPLVIGIGNRPVRGGEAVNSERGPPIPYVSGC